METRSQLYKKIISKSSNDKKKRVIEPSAPYSTEIETIIEPHNQKHNEMVIERFEENHPAESRQEENPQLPVDYYRRTKKYDRFTQFAALLSDEQIDLLALLGKKAMRSRKKYQRQDNAERITGNTVLRALLNRFATWADQVDLSNIQTEADLEREIERVILKA